VTTSSRRRRPGGRSARVRAAALEATIAELAETGYTGLTLDSVARRAGVHKTTLYRRWGTREALVLEAMLEHAGERVPIPDTGSLRGDLLALASSAAATAATPQGEAMVRAVVAAGAHDAALAAANRRFWSERLALDGEIVERAVGRGEVPADADPAAVIEAVLGPIYFRLLVTGEQPDPAFIELVVDLVTGGTGGRDRE
jgi:AcrR family transcriptional regulator